MRSQTHFNVLVALVFLGGSLLGDSAVVLAWTLTDDGNLFVATTTFLVGISMSIIGLIHVSAARRQLELAPTQGRSEAA
jgi:hypothetical protein